MSVSEIIMDFVGIDSSLTGTGFVIVNNGGQIQKNEVISTKSNDRSEIRIQQISNRIIELMSNYDIKSVYIEGLSYGSTGKSFSQLSALFYFILISIENNFNCDKKITRKVIPPGTLKKFITGKGTAKKELMLMKVYKRFGVEFDNSDLADAFSLAMLALEESK